MRLAVPALAVLLMAGIPGARAEEPDPAPTQLWDVSAVLDRAGIDRVWLDRAVAVVPTSLRNLDTADLPAQLEGYLSAQLKQMPGMGHSKQDEEMRAMVIAMGAMSGYMVAAMPLSLSGVVWAVAGGWAANYWYDNYR